MVRTSGGVLVSGKEKEISEGTSKEVSKEMERGRKERRVIEKEEVKITMAIP